MSIYLGSNKVSTSGLIKLEQQLPEYMSAKNFIFDGNACTGYVGDTSLPEIIIPKSYSKKVEVEYVKGQSIIKQDATMLDLYGNSSLTFIDDADKEVTYTDMETFWDNFETDFPDNVYLKQYDAEEFYAFDMAAQVFNYPVRVNGLEFPDEKSYRDYIRESRPTTLNFSGDFEIPKFFDGEDYQVNAIQARSGETSGFLNYSGTIILNNDIKEIKEYAFSEVVANIILVEGLLKIGKYGMANYHKPITLPIRLPNSLTTLDSDAFYTNSGSIVPRQLFIPKNVNNLGDYNEQGWRFAFTYYDLHSIEVDLNNQTYDSRDDCNCLIETNSQTIIKAAAKDSFIPDGIIRLAPYSFLGNTQESITIPDSVTSIGISAFSGCRSLISITLSNQLTNIARSAFDNCVNLKDITIPNSVTEIGPSVFFNCTSLVNINIPEGITAIEYALFQYCSNLRNITIPENVTYIAGSVFQGCWSLTEMTILATTPPTLASINAIPDATRTIRVPAESLDAYKTAPLWSTIAGRFVAI